MFHSLSGLITAAALLFIFAGVGGIGAESGVGAVCALAYHDANQNGARDFGEEALSEVSYNLMIASNVLVANYVALEGEPYCFENLPAQQYTLNVTSLLYVLHEGAITFFLQPNQRLTYEFGALYRPPQSAPSPQEAITVIPMTPAVRLVISISATLIVMLLCGAFGMIFYGLFLHQRPTLAAVSAGRQTGSSRVASERLKRSTRDLPPPDATAPVPRSERYRDLDSPDDA
ncbi:MAG: hypothetical protein CUN51_01095 [Candidatus Thermofonsia Clade 1 bacterium]|uniref:SD-repeat containing protein B domain-containing protein n=1 Tax=Candidatus Thermofonsia Clade 1 bacterium TaxID=2364210 RepID=A0A2M8P3Y7_9CHLR|nr:MAG: hypothetical protein CUN51_01095 [Candidatus Thermofonsia Clade 1 bacterium]